MQNLLTVIEMYGIINLSNERESRNEVNKMKDKIILKWDDSAQKYIVGRVGVFIDYKGNEFIDEEYFFYTNKTIEEVLKFLSGE